MGTTPYAFQAGSAAGLNCSGCVEPEALSPASLQVVREEALVAVAEAGYPMAAGDMPVDSEALGVEADDVQGALAELKELIDAQTSASNVNEGAGQVVSFPMSESVPSYGTATQYVHMVNPATPKVLTHLYGTQAAGGGGAGNLVVAYDFAPNQYSAGAGGEAGDNSMHVTNPSLFNTANHVLIYQTVGGSGTTTGTWEVNQVLSVNGNNLLLVKDLEHTYVTDDTAKAQVVLAASFGTFEVVGGGNVGPAAPLAADGSSGGIVYIRANQITVKNGGVIHADGVGFTGGAASVPGKQGASVCGAGSDGSASANCQGGGTGASYCAASGGGGNQTGGEDGADPGSCPADAGTGGEANPSDAALLHMGGGGGGVNKADGGAGGGLVILGAKSIIVETGGRISASGGAGQGGSGGGAGGTVALYTEVLQDDGQVSVAGGVGGEGSAWEFESTPFQTEDVSFDTHSHGGGYSPFYDEFWYPEWSGSTVYRMKPGNFQSLGTFTMPQNTMM